MAKKPKQQRLPGTEDSAIVELEDAATSYAELRDNRMKVLAQEVEIKGKLLRLMKAHRKKEYVRDGISIKIVPEAETVKVTIAKPKEEQPEEA